METFTGSIQLNSDTLNKIADLLEKFFKNKVYDRILSEKHRPTPEIDNNIELDKIDLYSRSKYVSIHIHDTFGVTVITTVSSKSNPVFCFEDNKVTISYKSNFSEGCITYTVTGEIKN